MDEDGNPSASSPLLDDTDNPSSIPLESLNLHKPPPTNPSYVVSPTGQTKPVIHEGVPYVPLISLPEGPAPPLLYYAPQEPNPTAGYAPDAPKDMALPLQPGSTFHQYPPQSVYMMPVPVSSSSPERSLEDLGGKARKAIPTLQKQKSLELLSDSSMDASLQASLSSVSAVGSPHRGATPLSERGDFSDSDGREKETNLYPPHGNTAERETAGLPPLGATLNGVGDEKLPVPHGKERGVPISHFYT